MAVNGRSPSRKAPRATSKPIGKSPSVRTTSLASAISKLSQEAIDSKALALQDASVQRGIAAAAQILAAAIEKNRTVFACGNGGSACDAMHLCEELLAQYKRKRPGVRAVHFMDASTLTCWGNDYSFDSAYARCAETFCSKGDVLIAISTSGKSPNVLAAAKVARKKGSKVIVLTGKGGGLLASLGDAVVNVPLNSTERIQEVHITCIHIWCEVLETGLAPRITN